MPKKIESAKSLSIFDDKAAQPTDAAIRSALGRAASAWDELVTHVEETYPAVVQQWHFAGVRFGWSLRLRSRDRVVLYLIPQSAGFLVGIVLGAKAVAAAQDAKLPARVLEAIARAPRYAEGTGLRLPVSKAADLPAIRKLAALKMSA